MRELLISQPIKGKTDEETLVVKKKAIESTKGYPGEPVGVVDSFFQNVPVDVRSLWYLGKSLELLATAGVAYFTSRWGIVRKCRTENTCVTEYGIDVIGGYAECIECPAPSGEATKALKTGYRTVHKGWNGENQYIQLVTNISYLDADGNAVNVEHEAIGNKAITFVGISGVQMGWLALQANMLVEDWKVTE